MDTLHALPKSMFSAVELLPDHDTPIVLFTRHSIRELVNGQGLAGYDLQLTVEGRLLAEAWGEYLTQQTQRQIVNCISSPIQRCLDTATLMIAGADRHFSDNTHQIEIFEESLLVEPGSFVVDIDLAVPHFRKKGAVSFIDSFVKNTLPGMKHPIRGVLDVLELLFHSHLIQAEKNTDTKKRALSLAVSHDTILAAFIAVISGHFQVQKKDWPEMMEGVFVWFDNTSSFEASKLNWVWRGERHQLNIRDLKGNI